MSQLFADSAVPVAADPGPGAAVVSRRPAAPEAAVEDARVGGRGGAGLDGRALDRGIAGSPAVRADVEVRQRSLEQEGDPGADGVAVVEQRDPVQGAHPLDLGGERRMVGGVEPRDPIRDLGLVRLGAVPPDRGAVEIGGRHEGGGVLAGVEAGARRIPIGVDDVAMERRPHGRRARQQPVVEAVDVPVRVAEAAAVPVQPFERVGRHVRPRVGEGEDDGRGTALDLEGVHRAPSRLGRMPGETPASIAPSATRAAAAARSPAM